MSIDVFVATSEDLIEGVIRDRQGELMVPIDLTGATVKLLLKLSPTLTKEVTATADGNQTLNPGKFSYQLAATDLPSAGHVGLQVQVTTGGKKHISKTINMGIEQALVKIP